MPFDEASLAGKSCNLDIFISFLHITVLIQVTIYLIGNIIGSFVGGWISTSIGRKKTIILFCIPLCGSWLLLASALNGPMVHSSMFLMGISISIPRTSAGRTRRSIIQM